MTRAIEDKAVGIPTWWYMVEILQALRVRPTVGFQNLVTVSLFSAASQWILGSQHPSLRFTGGSLSRDTYSQSAGKINVCSKARLNSNVTIDEFFKQKEHNSQIGASVTYICHRLYPEEEVRKQIEGFQCLYYLNLYPRASLCSVPTFFDCVTEIRDGSS